VAVIKTFELPADATVDSAIVEHIGPNEFCLN